MDAICSFLNAYLTVDNVVVTFVVVGTFVFSILATRAQAQLWSKTLHVPRRRREQQFITEARGHLR